MSRTASAASRIAPAGWKQPLRRIAGPITVLAAAAVAASPQKIRGYSCGHDFDFHLLSWFEAQDSWHRGLFYPHWAVSPNFGAGEPRFVFYPPLTWMLGAALHAIAQWGYVPLIFVFLLLAATGLAARALAREMLDEGAATLAGCAAIFSGYTLFTAYERSAFGELTGGFWIPLLLLFALRDRRPAASLTARALDGSALPLALVVAGTWLSDVPLGVMACYLLAAVALAAALLRRSWAPVIRATAGAALGIGLAGFYLVPAVMQQRWVDVAQAIDDPGTRIENGWLFARHSGVALELHDTELLKVSIIATSMLAVAFAGFAVSWFRNRARPTPARPQRDWWILLGLICATILLLQLPISLPIWNLLPKLRLMQFPWRWMVVLEAPMAILFAAAIWPSRRSRQVGVAVLCTALFAAAAYFADRVFLQGCDQDDSISGMVSVYSAGDGFAGIDEYEPPGADNMLVPTGLPGACLVSTPNAVLATPSPDTNPDWDAADHACEATYPATWTSAEDFRIAANANHAGYLVLRLRSYPAWRITINGLDAKPAAARDDGLVALAVPPGPANIEARWITTGDTIAGRWLSLAALLLLTGVLWMERKSPHPQLS